MTHLPHGDLMKRLFSERYGGGETRIVQQLTVSVKATVLQIVQTKVEDNAFGNSFPSRCPDGPVNAGTDENAIRTSMAGFRVIWPADHRGEEGTLSDSQIYDLIEYIYEHVATALPGSYHGFFSHYHYTYNQDDGRQRFAEEVNRLFERNGIAYELAAGQVDRIAPMVLRDILAVPAFRTGDVTLDELLSTARDKFQSRDEIVRRESLEKLWDAWERLKTLVYPDDKKRSVTALLDRVSSEPEFRQRLETEAKQLTEIGNAFLIRHTEVGKAPVQSSNQVDYLFHRLFAFIRLVLQAYGIAL
jgi:hypothetical protein